MATPQRLDPATLTETVTDSVRLWLADEDDGAAVSLLARRYGPAGACQAALDADDLDEAAHALRSWFTERLTVDPGVPGRFGPLARTLIGASLGLVDWRDLADEIRD